jgi:DNA polymerase-3 subunit alpha
MSRWAPLFLGPELSERWLIFPAMNRSRREFLGGAAAVASGALLAAAGVAGGASPVAASAELRMRARAGLRRRLRGALPAPIYARRLESELACIEELAYAVPFLYFDDVFKSARSRGVVTGFGQSAAPGSLVCWSLGITNIDPIRRGLLFERFVNRRRTRAVDVWVEVSSHEELMASANEIDRWGPISATPPDYDPLRCLLTEAADRCGDVSSRLQDLLALLPESRDAPPGRLRKIIAKQPTLSELYERHPVVRRWFDTAMELERNAVVHLWTCCLPGVKLFDTHELRCSVVPALGQCQMRGADAQARLFTKLARGEDVPLIGFSSAGMRDLLHQIRPRSVEQLAAVLALYRPGPLEVGIVDEYVRRACTGAPALHQNADVSEILAPTFGLIIYQEQVMSIAARVAGLELEEADLMRRALGKRAAKHVDPWRESFVDGATRHGVDGEQAHEIFEQLLTSTAFTFNKSHAVAAATLAVRVPVDQVI